MPAGACQPGLVDFEQVRVGIPEVIDGFGPKPGTAQGGVICREKPLDAAEGLDLADKFSATQARGSDGNEPLTLLCDRSPRLLEAWACMVPARLLGAQSGPRAHPLFLG